MDNSSYPDRKLEENAWRTVYEWEHGGLLDPEEKTVEVNQERIRLTPQEFSALQVLIENAPNGVAEAVIYARVWGSVVVEPSSVAKLMYRLRQKIIDGKPLVSAKDAVGYRFTARVTISRRKRFGPEVRPLIVAAHASEGRVVVGVMVTFTCEPHGGRPPYEVLWSGFTEATGEVITHSFSVPGVYTVSAKVTDVRGVTAFSEPVNIEAVLADDVHDLKLIQVESKSVQHPVPSRISSVRSKLTMRVVLTVLLLVCTATFGVLKATRANWFARVFLSQVKKEIKSPADDAEIRRVLTESQMYEALVIYENPKGLDPNKLKDYWVPVEKGGRAILSIQSAVFKQLQRKVHYGSESKAEVFEIIQVTIFSPGDYAEARTREKWYLPTYHEDESRAAEKNPFIGPYQIDYTFRKIDGKWLLQSASTPYSQ